MQNPTISVLNKYPKELKEPKQILYAHGHSGTIHKSQKVETTQVSMDRWIDKQIVVYTYSGILLSLKKE